LKKLKIYLDTSVISYLDQQDAPDKMADTLKLWEQIRLGKYEAVISDVALDEIAQCDEPKRSVLERYLAGVPFTAVAVNMEAQDLAKQFIDNHVLTNKSVDDCRHIACAMLYGCDMIVSWNFKHIVNYRTIQGVKLISIMTGYDEVAIYTPTILIGGDDPNA